MLPHEATASHEAVVALAEKALSAGLEANIRVIVARDPRDANDSWRPACGRIDLVRRGDPPVTDCRPKGAARILEERLEGADLVRRLRQAMSGGSFAVCSEEFSEHGMHASWFGFQHTWDWRDEGTTWPCTVLAPESEISHRPVFHDMIEDDGPRRIHDGLDALVRNASGFRVTPTQGRDTRFSRFQLLIWDYRGRIDTLEVHRERVSVEVSPPSDSSLKLVGLVSGTRTREPLICVGPSRVAVTLGEAVIAARFELRSGEYDVVAEAHRDLRSDGITGGDICDAIIGAVARSLQPAFETPPTSEKEVQREIEKILRTLGLAFHREKERAPLGPTAFIPDFTLPDFSLAIEVKLAKPGGHGEAAIQRQLAEDSAGYGTQWAELLVIVYDSGGVIRDPERMRLACEKQLGVRIVVVKH